MKTKWFLLLTTVLAALNMVNPAKAQFFLDCSCLATQSVLFTNACQAVVPDLCQFTNCVQSTVVGQPPPVVTCNQSPAAGTPVGPGAWPVTVTITDANGVQSACALLFTVTAPVGANTLLCAPNKTVECGTTWVFDPPTATNFCCPIFGIPGGVIIIDLGAVTNGTCPQVITQSWQAVDGCMTVVTCSQTVTVVDTTPPVLNCSCLTNSAGLPPLPLTVTNCADVIPDLCQIALFCASDACGPLACSQTPTAGTGVGPGVYPITVTVFDCASNSAQCVVNFTVVAPSSGCVTNPCPTNNLVVNGSFEAGAFFVNGSGCEQLLLGSVVMPGWTVVVDEIARCQNGNFSGTTASDAVRFLDLSGYTDSPPHGGVAQTVPTAPAQVYNLSFDLGCNPSDPPLNGPITVRVTVTGSPPQLFTHNPAGLGTQWGTYGFQFAAVGASTVITIEGVSGNGFIGLDNVILLADCCVPPPPGMVAWWPLDELTGATLFVDATGNGHTALVESGGPVGNPGSPFAVAGNVAGANYFYGLSSRGRAVGPLLNFGTSDFSADCWVNPIPTGVIFWHPIVDKLNQTGPTTGFGYTVGLLNQNVVLKVGDGAIATYTSVGTVTYNAWGFVAVVVNRALNTVTFHVNGVTEPAQTLAPLGNINSAIDVLIGPTWNNALPLGELAVDELELFNTILTTNDLNALWTADSFGKCKTNLCIVSMFCPSNVITTANCTQMCAVVNYPSPLVTNGVLAGCTPPPGGCFPTGITVVTCTATNACGVPAVCNFTITVNAPTNCCVSQTNIWNSGMGGTNALPPGTPDPNYVLVSAPPGGCTGPAQVIHPATIPAPPWITNGPNSQWLGASLGAMCQEGVYRYRLCFYLPCTDGASIIGQWAVDDHGAIHLNGQPTGNTVPSQQYPNLPGYGWFPVSITNGFLCGTNCLDFYVTNANIGINPTGFRAELTNVFNDCCCEPAQTVFAVNSGHNLNGPLPLAAPDNQFALTCAPPGVGATTPVVVTPHPLYLPNGPNSQWIVPGPGIFSPAGVYCYTLTFNLPPCTNGNPSYSVNGQWMVDDTGTIHLNGNPTGITLPSGLAFTNWHPFSITSGLVPGLNTLTCYVTNASDGRTGLRLELTATASCCDCTDRCSCTFTNGGFNLPVPANGTGGGWTASGVFGGAGWQAGGGNPGGTFLLNNVGDPATDPTISQTLCCLTPGQCYTIRGQRKVQAWYGVTAPSFAVLVDGVPILTLPVPTNPADANWHNFAVSFTATNTCQTIGFASEINGTDVSYWIDNIRLECCNPNCRVMLKCPPNQVLIACTNSAIGTYKVAVSGNNGPVLCTPPSGSAFPLGTNTVICTATNNCGDIVTCTFTITVKPPPPHWPCPPNHLGIGIPFDLVGGATTAIRPVGPGLPVGPAICVFPNPNLPNTPSGILLTPGTAQAVTFTTELHFDAPEGASLELALPPDPANPDGTPLLSFIRKSGPGGYCVKTNKKFTDDNAATYRSIAIGTNGELFSSITWDAENMDTNVLLNINHLPGVTSVVMTVSIDCRTREVTLDLSHCLWTYDAARKGWDGCIYGNVPPGSVRGRLILTPVTPVVSPPITELALVATGLSEVLVDDPTLTALGRKWGDGHVTLMKAYDDGGEQGVEFVALDDGGGVHVDLGHSESFDLRLTHFDSGEIPGEEYLLTRTIGPIALTNRPSPPPFLDAMLLKVGFLGVECSADFSNLGSPTVLVQIYDHGMFVTERAGVPAILGDPLFGMGGWPDQLGKFGGGVSCRRGKNPSGFFILPGSAGLPPEFVFGDEFRVLAELPPDAPLPDYYSAFEFITSSGADWGITQLQRTLACAAAAELSIALTPDGTTLEWSAAGYRLLGAETLDGPWYELGVESPASISTGAAHRFYRLACD